MQTSNDIFYFTLDKPGASAQPINRPQAQAYKVVDDALVNTKNVIRLTFLAFSDFQNYEDGEYIKDEYSRLSNMIDKKNSNLSNELKASYYFRIMELESIMQRRKIYQNPNTKHELLDSYSDFFLKIFDMYLFCCHFMAIKPEYPSINHFFNQLQVDPDESITAVFFDIRAMAMKTTQLLPTIYQAKKKILQFESQIKAERIYVEEKHNNDLRLFQYKVSNLSESILAILKNRLIGDFIFKLDETPAIIDKPINMAPVMPLYYN